MEEKKEITWESPEVNAEQMLSECTAQNEWFAGIRKQLAESNEITHEVIGRMCDEEVMVLAEICLDELENREYSVLRACVNLSKTDSAYMLDVCGRVGDIASMLTYLCAKREAFEKCVLAVAKALQENKEEIVAAKKKMRRQLMSKRVYISGPISGYDLAERKETFERAAKRFMMQGYLVSNPFNSGVPATASWEEHMKADIAMLMQCDIIYMLSGWHTSRGATIERNLAEEVGIKVMQERHP